MEAQVTLVGKLDMQVCVSENWSDDEVENFTNTQNQSGTSLVALFISC